MIKTEMEGHRNLGDSGLEGTRGDLVENFRDGMGEGVISAFSSPAGGVERNWRARVE